MKTNAKEILLDKKNIIIGVLSLLLLILVLILIITTNNKCVKEKPANSTENEVKYSVKKWNGEEYKPTKNFVIEEGEVEDEYCSSVKKYTNVATLNNDDLLIRINFESVDGYDFFSYFVITKNNEVFSIDKNNNKCFTKDVIKDKEIIIPEIEKPKTITYKNLTFTYEDFEYFNKDKKQEKLMDINDGAFYKEIIPISENEKLNNIGYLFINGDKEVNYYYTYNDKVINDDHTLNAKWDDEKNKLLTWNNYAPDHCAANPHGAGYYINNFDINKGVKLGKTNDGSTIYKINDAVILDTLYLDNSLLYDSKLDKLIEVPFETYKRNISALTYKDVLGNWRILRNRDYSSAGECGKPVIYLYPEKDTLVNVSVAAEVTISDPLYPNGGWKNVYARPNGELTYNNQKYDSLFWEGLGYGVYPNLNNIGKVVKQKDLLKTIEKDLDAQGLNKKEIADFMEFWSDNLPKTPYVKISWFTTKQMNQLAPLKVNPKPDTVIRVFLDARGLNKPVKLTPQKLTKIERIGFTLVEWGGYLKTKSK